MTTRTIDYSVWDHIEVSDDEDETHPNIDTPSLFRWRHQSVLNIKPEPTEETEEQKEEKHQTFVEKHEKQIKHFGMLRRWEDSQKYLSDHPYLKHGLMDQAAHQTIVMQFILELAKSLKIDPRGCFRQFFQKIKAMEEYEEEERQNRLGPGGLDPVESQTLQMEMKKCFDDKDISMLQEAISKMDPMEAKVHIKRCIDSGLWVPNANTDNEDAENEEEEKEDKEDEEEPEKEEK
ncbi:unnamed protein product [Coregonus sp. 'balchen']|nr:unnamed protein product [Coregonus sp. 'balchen']